MAESSMGRTCACTPRSLLVPAGGVKTLDPSQRVSAKELEARDREWQRKQKRKSSSHHGEVQAHRIDSKVSLQRPPSYTSSAVDQDVPLSGQKPNVKVTKSSFASSLFGRKGKASKTSSSSNG